MGEELPEVERPEVPISEKASRRSGLRTPLAIGQCAECDRDEARLFTRATGAAWGLSGNAGHGMGAGLRRTAEKRPEGDSDLVVEGRTIIELKRPNDPVEWW